MLNLEMILAKDFINFLMISDLMKTPQHHRGGFLRVGSNWNYKEFENAPEIRSSSKSGRKAEYLTKRHPQELTQ